MESNYDLLSVVVSVSVALAAVIAPILTSIINNHYQMKLKKIELKQQEYERTAMHQREILENYLIGLSQLSQLRSDPIYSLYSKYYPLAFSYVPANVRVQLSEANTCINSHDWNGVINFVDPISTEISALIRQL